MDEGTEKDYEERFYFFFIFFFSWGTGENINHGVWIVIGQGKVESMRGYPEVKFGRK